ncbi:hypothetical protein GCM10009558_108120 [Virgisporangium aurantiacum]
MAGNGALERLPEWVTLLVVADRDDPAGDARGAALRERLLRILGEPGANRVKRVGEVEEFVQLMPALITEARREFLRKAPVFPPKGAHVPRPTMSGHGVSTAPPPKEVDS